MSIETTSSEVLSKIHVAKACPADWRQMKGTDQVRHCTHCSRNVYNISEMSRQEAAELIQQTEGRMCVRYYSRPDGSIMTRDCGKPVGQPKNIVTTLCWCFGWLGLSTIILTVLSITTRDGSSSNSVDDRRSILESLGVTTIFAKVQHALGSDPSPTVTTGKLAFTSPITPPSSVITTSTTGEIIVSPTRGRTPK